MTIRLIIGVLAFVIAMTGCAVGNFTVNAMIEELDKNWPDDRPKYWTGFSFGCLFDILLDYQAYCPLGRLRRRFRVAQCVAFGGMALTVACMLIRFK